MVAQFVNNSVLTVTQVNHMVNQINTNEGDIATNAGDITTNAEDITTNTEDIVAIDGRVTELESTEKVILLTTKKVITVGATGDYGNLTDALLEAMKYKPAELTPLDATIVIEIEDGTSLSDYIYINGLDLSHIQIEAQSCTITSTSSFLNGVNGARLPYIKSGDFTYSGASNISLISLERGSSCVLGINSCTGFYNTIHVESGSKVINTSNLTITSTNIDILIEQSSEFTSTLSVIVLNGSGAKVDAGSKAYLASLDGDLINTDGSISTIALRVSGTNNLTPNTITADGIIFE